LDGAALGFRSELIFHRFDGEVTDLRATHGVQVIRTPSNPTFFWGNFLLFNRAPGVEDAARWPALFAQLIESRQPQSTHQAFGWLEDAPGEVDAFVAAGYTRNDTTVLQATQLPVAPAPRIAVQLRPFNGDRDWAMQLHADVASRDPMHSAADYLVFCERRNSRWRAMIAAGLGQWFGAFVTDGATQRLAASLGVFVEAQPVDGERLARFQWVSTQPRYQRQGLCRALLAHAAQFACDVLRADRLVIAAAADEMPEQLYRAAGFADAGHQRGLQRLPPE